MSDIVPPMPPQENPGFPSDLEAAPYPSLAVMRDTHRILLRTFRAEGNTEEFAAAVLDFVIQGSATGMVLDVEDDRWAAQNMIDYWATMLYRWGYEGFDAELDEYDFDYAPELPESACPYLGLNTYGEGQHEQFFGRERLITTALETIEKNRLAVVSGLSGSGKSSLVIAGILPTLKEGGLPQGSEVETTADGVSTDSSQWLYLPKIVPSHEPLKNLAAVLLPEDAAGQALAHQIRALRNDSSALVTALDQLVSEVDNTKTAVLFIDEFEELFTVCKDEEERDRYMANLLTLLASPRSPHVLIIAMHSDYEGLVTTWPDMVQRFKQAMIRMTPPNAAELRDVIVKPAQNIGLRFEEGLVDRLLQDVSGEQTALPLLQFTLLRLWDYRDRNRITWDAYNQVGSGRGSLLTAVNSFYRNLSKKDRAIAKKIFLKFVIPHEESIELVRVTRKNLYQLAEDPSRIQALLDQLLEMRLIRLTKESTFEEDQFDLVHSALAQDWAQYVEWLEEARAEQYELLRLRTAAQQWRDAGRETSRLRRGELLQTSLRYLSSDAIGPLEREFLQESSREEERLRQEEQAAVAREEELKDKLIDEQTKANSRLRTFVGVLTVAAVVAVLASVLALTQRNQAVMQAEIAATSEGVALEQAEIAATSERNAIHAQATAEAARAEALAQANAAATAEAGAVSAQATAEVARADALAQANAAATAEAEARASANEAQQQANIARSGRLAVQGFGLRLEESDLALLLALQAINIANTVEAQSSLLGILQGISQQISLVRRLVIEGHEERVFAATFNPTGNLLATGGYDNKIYFWDVETGQQIGEVLERHSNWVRRVVFSADGTLLASAGYDNRIILWDVAGLSEGAAPTFLSQFSGHADVINAVVFIPTTNPTTGRFLATASRDETIVLWDITNPRQPVRLSTPQGGHTDKIYTMVVSPDGRTLISAGADQRVLFWNISNPGRPSQPFRTLEDHEAEINALAISEDGRYLASGDDAGVIIIWDTATGQRLGTLLGHSNWILGLDFDPTGQYLASSSRDGNIFLWDVEERTRLSGPFSLHQDWVWDVAFNQDGTQLVSAGRDGRVILWDVKRNPQLETVVAASEQFPITAVAFPTADTVNIAAGGTISTFPIAEEAEAERSVTLEISPSQQATLLLAADGRWAAAYEGKQLLLWNVDQGGVPVVLGEHNSFIQDIAFSADSQRLASVSCAYDNAANLAGGGASESGSEGEESMATPSSFFIPTAALCTQSEIRIWDVEERQAVGETLVADELELVSVALDSTGNWVAGGGCARFESEAGDDQVAQDAGDKNICLDGIALAWEIVDGTAELRQRFTAREAQFAQLDFVRALAFSPDRNLLAVGSNDGTLLFWNVANGAPLSKPQNAHSGQLTSIVFNPDGTMMATTGNDALVVLWDVATRQPLASELRGHEGAVLSLQFGPDGGLLVTGGSDGQAIVWRASLETWRPLACAIAGRDLTESEWAQYVGDDIVQQPICEFAE